MRGSSYRTEAGVGGSAGMVGKGGLAVLEQGLFAGSHFALNILLARWLSPVEYGAFATTYSLFLLAAACHHALLAEPMMVFGAGKFRSVFPAYLSKLVHAHVWLLLPFGLAALAGVIAVSRGGGGPIASTFLGLALAGGFILLLNLFRRALFTRLLTGWSALGGALYAVVLIGSAVLLAWLGWLSAFSAFIAMGAAASLTVVLSAARMRTPGSRSRSDLEFREILGEHWSYGRWALASVLPMWVYGNVYYLMLPPLVGLEGAGEFRAVVNLIMPVLHTFTALSLFLLPVLVRTLESSGPEAFRRLVRKVSLLFLLAAAGYLALLIPLGDAAIGFLYAGQYAARGVTGMLLLGLIPLAWAPISVFAGVLRAVERPDLVFQGQLIAAGVATIAGALLIWGDGVRGGMVAMFLSALVGGTVLAALYRARISVVQTERSAS